VKVKTPRPNPIPKLSPLNRLPSNYQTTQQVTGSLVPFVAFALGRSLMISCSFLLIRVGIIVIPYALSKGILFSSIYLGKGKVDLSIETYVLGSFIRLLFFVCFGL
jgi:hypothetical protein